jgi:hypothetical protein
MVAGHSPRAATPGLRSSPAVARDEPDLPGCLAGVAGDGLQGTLARDLPETALRATSPRLTPRPSTASLTCVTVWAREVLQGVVNPPRIDGKDGVAGSIPAGGSTKPMTSANAGHLHVRGPVERAILVVLAFGCRWMGACRMESTSLVSTPAALVVRVVGSVRGGRGPGGGAAIVTRPARSQAG